MAEKKEKKHKKEKQETEPDKRGVGLTPKYGGGVGIAPKIGGGAQSPTSGLEANLGGNRDTKPSDKADSGPAYRTRTGQEGGGAAPKLKKPSVPAAQAEAAVALQQHVEIPKQPDDLVTICFRKLGLEHIDQVSFTQELRDALCSQGMTKYSVKQLKINLREGSVLADIRGGRPYINQVKRKVAAGSIRVLDSLASLSDDHPLEESGTDEEGGPHHSNNEYSEQDNAYPQRIKSAEGAYAEEANNSAHRTDVREQDDFGTSDLPHVDGEDDDEDGEIYVYLQGKPNTPSPHDSPRDGEVSASVEASRLFIPGTYQVNADSENSHNLRSAPWLSAPKVGSLEPGDVVDIDQVVALNVGSGGQHVQDHWGELARINPGSRPMWTLLMNSGGRRFLRYLGEPKRKQDQPDPEAKSANASDTNEVQQESYEWAVLHGWGDESNEPIAADHIVAELISSGLRLEFGTGKKQEESAETILGLAPPNPEEPAKKLLVFYVQPLGLEIAGSRLTVQNVIEGSPADSKGVKKGWSLKKVNDTDVTSLSVDEAMTLYKSHVALLPSVDGAFYTNSSNDVGVSGRWSIVPANDEPGEVIDAKGRKRGLSNVNVISGWRQEEGPDPLGEDADLARKAAEQLAIGAMSSVLQEEKIKKAETRIDQVKDEVERLKVAQKDRTTYMQNLQKQSKRNALLAEWEAAKLGTNLKATKAVDDLNHIKRVHNRLAQNEVAIIREGRNDDEALFDQVNDADLPEIVDD